MILNLNDIIENIKSLKYEDDRETHQEWFNEGVNEVLHYLDQLKEDLPVVPAIVDEFLNRTHSNKTQLLAYLIQQKKMGVASVLKDGDLRTYVMSVDMSELINLANGYTVADTHDKLILQQADGTLISEWDVDKNNTDTIRQTIEGCL